MGEHPSASRKQRHMPVASKLNDSFLLVADLTRVRETHKEVQDWYHRTGSRAGIWM